MYLVDTNVLSTVERDGNIWSYRQPVTHVGLAGGRRQDGCHILAHAGPWSRGIRATFSFFAMRAGVKRTVLDSCLEGPV
jgi:hypothetical protein